MRRRADHGSQDCVQEFVPAADEHLVDQDFREDGLDQTQAGAEHAEGHGDEQHVPVRPDVLAQVSNCGSECIIHQW